MKGEVSKDDECVKNVKERKGEREWRSSVGELRCYQVAKPRHRFRVATERDQIIYIILTPCFLTCFIS